MGTQKNGLHEHPKQILKQMGKKIFTFLPQVFSFTLSYWQMSYKEYTCMSHQEILVLIAKAQRPALNFHVYLSSETKLCKKQ